MTWPGEDYVDFHLTAVGGMAGFSSLHSKRDDCPRTAS
jgi:hypothetical protein